MKRARSKKVKPESTSPPKKAKPENDVPPTRRPKTGAAKRPQRKAVPKRLYDFPEPMPVGEVLQDTAKGQWKLGKSIGRGGFGELYVGESRICYESPWYSVALPNRCKLRIR